jgi:hypothetical protein
VNTASPVPDPAAATSEWSAYWNEFRDALDNAIVAVPAEYFRIKRYADDDPHPRERAYCYELYHRLRLRLRADFPYLLHAEIDKAGHVATVTAFGPKARPNPDFIIHKPTLMGRGHNLGIIEVKASDEGRTAVGRDLCKILKFLRRVGYLYGLMLFFGAERPKAVRPFEGIEFVWHHTVGQRPLTSENGQFN